MCLGVPEEGGEGEGKSGVRGWRTEGREAREKETLECFFFNKKEEKLKGDTKQCLLLTFHDNSERIFEDVECGEEHQNTKQESADGVCQLQVWLHKLST